MSCGVQLGPRNVQLKRLKSMVCNSAELQLSAGKRPASLQQTLSLLVVEGTALGVAKDVKTTYHYSTCIFTKTQCGDLDLD